MFSQFWRLTKAIELNSGEVLDMLVPTVLMFHWYIFICDWFKSTIYRSTGSCTKILPATPTHRWTTWRRAASPTTWWLPSCPHLPPSTTSPTRSLRAPPRLRAARPGPMKSCSCSSRQSTCSPLEPINGALCCWLPVSLKFISLN